MLLCAVQFMEWSRCVCDKLQEQGYWCDFIDPCSGLPVSTQPQQVQLCSAGCKGLMPCCSCKCCATCRGSHSPAPAQSMAAVTQVSVAYTSSSQRITVTCTAVPAGPAQLPQMIQQGTNNVYPEVEGLSLLLGFKTQNAGCCKVSNSVGPAGFGALLSMLQDSSGAAACSCVHHVETAATHAIPACRPSASVNCPCRY